MKIKKKNKGIIPGVHLWGRIFFFFRERSNTHVYSPQIRSPQQIQIQEKANLMNQWALLRLLKGLLTEAEMTQNSCVTTARPLIHDFTRAGNLEHTIYSLQEDQQLEGTFFPNDSAGLNLFQVSSSRKVVCLWEQSSANFTVYILAVWGV